MKTDRELLELAAKVAGVVGHFVEKHPEDGAPAYSYGIGYANQIAPLWNPLTNDGDALRLLVLLGSSHHVMALSIGNGSSACEFNYVPHAGNPLEATRRAIVIAVAAIGESMR